MVGWYQWLDGHEFEQALAVGDRQGSLACCGPWGSQRVRHDWVTELSCTWLPCHNSVFLAAPYVVRSPNRVQLFAAPWTTVHQASLSFTSSQSLPKFMSIALVMPSSHLILWRPLILLPLKPETEWRGYSWKIVVYLVEGWKCCEFGAMESREHNYYYF